MEKLVWPSQCELVQLLLPEWCRPNFSSDNSVTAILLCFVSAFRNDLNHPNRTNTAKVTEDLVKAVQLGHFGPSSTVVGFSLRCFSCPGPIGATKFGLCTCTMVLLAHSHHKKYPKHAYALARTGHGKRSCPAQSRSYLSNHGSDLQNPG